MNDEQEEFVNNDDNISFGLSTLHARIRCFGCFLHIYLFNIWMLKWQITAAVKERKNETQLKFKTEIGLMVDKP